MGRAVDRCGARPLPRSGSVPRHPQEAGGRADNVAASRLTASPVRPQVIAVLGPTASGKSALGVSLARGLDGEIVNCDSTAVYRGFDIGTDKVSEEGRGGIPHHLIDICDPSDVYTAAQFARDA